MATSTIQRDFSKQNSGPAEVIPLPPGKQLPSGEEPEPGFRDLLVLYAQVAAHAFELARLSVVKTYYRARNGALQGYSQAAVQSREMASRTEDEAIYLKSEHPVRVLAMIAGAAFVAGAVTRIWRSRA
jgi:hypothetical protein